MTNTWHVIFGNESHRNNYARRMAVNPIFVLKATEPELIQKLVKEPVDTVKVIRLPKDVWKPTTDPCVKRVKETEDILKGLRRLGITIVEVEQ